MGEMPGAHGNEHQGDRAHQYAAAKGDDEMAKLVLQPARANALARIGHQRGR